MPAGKTLEKRPKPGISAKCYAKQAVGPRFCAVFRTFSGRNIQHAVFRDVECAGMLTVASPLFCPLKGAKQARKGFTQLA
ncbi:MAG: hypothetical protein JXQ29_10125, partial [Planctomycetes bacterium]|nr:hypothetical protein [Planctomycetota bacterium]